MTQNQNDFASSVRTYKNSFNGPLQNSSNLVDRNVEANAKRMQTFQDVGKVPTFGNTQRVQRDNVRQTGERDTSK